jgi:hypothetical protein
MPDLAFRNATSAYDASLSASSIVSTLPAGTVAGDLMVIWSVAAALSPAAAPTIPTPSGWTLATGMPSTGAVAGGAANARLYLFYKIAGGSEGSVTLSASANAILVAARLSYQNPNPTSFFGQVIPGSGGASNTAVVPGMTTVRANSLRMDFIVQGVAQGITPPGTMNERVDNATGGFSVHDAIIAAPGATGTRTYSQPSSADKLFSTAEFFSANVYSLIASTGSFALSGQAAGLKVARRLVAEAGVFTLTGQAAGIGKSYPLVAAAGAFVLTGQAATLRATRLLSAAPGSFTLTGVAAWLKIAYRLAAGTGSFVVTGQAASLYRGYTLVAGAGAFTLTGQAAGLLHARVLAAATGSFSLTGQAATFRRALRLSAGPGAFTLTGLDAGLNVAGNSALAAETGAFVLTGQAAGLRATRRLSAAPGSFNLTGQAAGMRVARLLTGDAGAFVLVGQAAGLRVARFIAAAAGSFVLTGQAAFLRWHHRLQAEPGSFLLIGQPATLTYSGATPVIVPAPAWRTWVLAVPNRQLELLTPNRTLEA